MAPTLNSPPHEGPVMPESLWQRWKRRAADIQREVHALYLACRDPRTPWPAKALGLCVIAYALSPIDLIPDMIPIVGHLDDLVLVPLGILLVRRLIPPAVLDDCRRRAEEQAMSRTAAGRVAACVIAVIWLSAAVIVGRALW